MDRRSHSVGVGRGRSPCIGGADLHTVERARAALASIVLRAGPAFADARAHLQSGLRLGEVGQRILAFHLVDVDDRRLYQDARQSSALQFAERELGLDRRRARELLRVRRKLGELARIDAVFREGRLGWAKVVRLRRVVSPGHAVAVQLGFGDLWMFDGLINNPGGVGILEVRRREDLLQIVTGRGPRAMNGRRIRNGSIPAPGRTDASRQELGCHGATVSRRIRLHRTLMLEDSEYARRAGVAARRVLDLALPRAGSQNGANVQQHLAPL